MFKSALRKLEDQLHGVIVNGHSNIHLISGRYSNLPVHFNLCFEKNHSKKSVCTDCGLSRQEDAKDSWGLDQF